MDSLVRILWQLRPDAGGGKTKPEGPAPKAIPAEYIAVLLADSLRGGTENNSTTTYGTVLAEERFHY